MNTIAEGERAQDIPANNMNNERIPTVADVPKNNYDDRGYQKVNEKAKIAFSKHRIDEALRSRNVDRKEKLKSPNKLRKSDDKSLLTQRIANDEYKLLQVCGNASIKHMPSESPLRATFFSKKNLSRMGANKIYTNQDIDFPDIKEHSKSTSLLVRRNAEQELKCKPLIVFKCIL